MLCIFTFEVTAASKTAPQTFRGIPGCEQALAYQINKRSSCYVYKRYVVISEYLTQSVGSDIWIKLRPKGNRTGSWCDKTQGSLFMAIKNEGAEYFFGLIEDYVILDSGTGPGTRGFYVYDLKKKSKVYEGNYSDFVTADPGTSLTYWMETGVANQGNCKEYNRWRIEVGGAAIERKVRLNLKTFRLDHMKETRCWPRP